MTFTDFWAAVAMLAALVCGEAGAEPYDGQRAVAHVAVNRTISERFPNELYAVIWQPYQFSAANDGRLYHYGEPTESCQRAAYDVLANRTHDPTGQSSDPTGGAFFYHTDSIHPPWARNMTERTRIGVHIFY